MDNVYHGIWLGNVNAARDADGLRRAGVTHIINCAAAVPVVFPHDFAYHRWPRRHTVAKHPAALCRDIGMHATHAATVGSSSCIASRQIEISRMRHRILIDTEGMAMREALALLQSACPVVRLMRASSYSSSTTKR